MEEFFDIRQAIQDVFNIVSTYGKEVKRPAIPDTFEYELDGVIAYKQDTGCIQRDPFLDFSLVGFETPEGSISSPPHEEDDMTDNQVRKVLRKLQRKFQ